MPSLFASEAKSGTAPKLVKALAICALRPAMSVVSPAIRFLAFCSP
jgi:hypothetical protein